MTIDRAPAVRLFGHAPQRRKAHKCTREVHPGPRRRKAPLCEPPHRRKPMSMAGSRRARWKRRGRPMQMHQIRYFLALCEERNFTRAARRCGVSQPSLTNAIIGLERVLGGALFQRKPLIALTVLGHAIHPYLDRIAQNAEHAREAAQALAEVPPANSEPPTLDKIARSPLSPSS